MIIDMNELANILLVDYVDKVEKKLSNAFCYGIIHRLPSDANIEDEINLVLSKLSSAACELEGCVKLSIYDPRRTDAVDAARSVVKRAVEVIDKAIAYTDSRLLSSMKLKTDMLKRLELLDDAKAAAITAVKALGGKRE